MVHINLLPWRAEQRAIQHKQFNNLLIATIIAGIIVVLLMHMLNAHRIHHQLARNNFLTKTIADVSSKQQGNFKIEQQQKLLINQLQAIQNIYVSRFDLIRALDTLPRVMPEGTYLTQLQYSQNQYTLTGYAVSNSQVTVLMKNMAQSNWTVNPVLEDVTAGQQNGMNMKNFKLLIK